MNMQVLARGAGGSDRFHVWRDKGNYWCRPGPGHCGKTGFIDQLTGEELTPEQRRILALEYKQRQMERRQEEAERRLTALEQMARCTDHLRYHQNLARDAINYWHAEGMTSKTVKTHRLGYCNCCPTDRESRASYTIPVYGRDGETLTNIRHRLVNADGDKYRPHMAGLGAQLFNAKFTTTASGKILVLEGEKKSLILEQEGFANVGIMGQHSFNREWIKWLEPFATVYVALDPDAQESARRLAALFDGRARVVTLPCKADDFFVKHKGTRDDFEYYIEIANPVKGN